MVIALFVSWAFTLLVSWDYMPGVVTTLVGRDLTARELWALYDMDNVVTTRRLCCPTTLLMSGKGHSIISRGR